MTTLLIKRCISVISLHTLKTDCLGCVLSSASFKLKVPPNYDHVQYPEKRRPRIINKVPWLDPSNRPPKHTKMLDMMRGPELVHHRLQYGDYGVQVIKGGRLTHELVERIRMILVRQMDERNMFAVWRFNSLWQSVTRKGKGVRMGGGKGSINHYCMPVRAERLILEVGGECEAPEVLPMLREIVRILPFQARVISHESVQYRKEKEAWEEENNINPFTFKHCADNNILGCQKHLNRYDFKWYNKYQ